MKAVIPPKINNADMVGGMPRGLAVGLYFAAGLVSVFLSDNLGWFSLLVGIGIVAVTKWIAKSLFSREPQLLTLLRWYAVIPFQFHPGAELIEISTRGKRTVLWLRPLGFGASE